MTMQREGFVEDGNSRAHSPPPQVKAEEKQKPRHIPPPIIEASPAEQPSPIEKDEWPIVIKLLHRPIKDNKGLEIKTVTLREPRAGDINRYGNPVRVNQEGDVVIDERKMTYMIAALSDVLVPFIEDMDPRDWNSCAYRIRRFFLPDPAAW